MLMAISIYLIAGAFVLTGLWLLSQPSRSLLNVPIGALLVLMGWMARPRWSEAPDRLVERKDFPVLHALADRVATAMGTPPLAGIGISADFGANYREAGWRGRRYVELGAPLLAILSAEEQIAVMAHELSHGVNGDPLRDRFLAGAMQTLSGWAAAIRPSAIGRSANGIAFGPIISLVLIPLDLLMLAISELMFFVLTGMLLLVLRQSQRAEYLADRLAARVASPAAMRDALDKVCLAEVVDSTLHTHALTRPDAPIAPVLIAACESLSAEERQAWRERSRADLSQVDATHPPTALRIDILARMPEQAAIQLLSASEVAALASEVNRLGGLLHREMINRELEAING